MCDDYDSLTLLPFLRERIIGYHPPDGLSGFAICDMFLPEEWYRMADFVLTNLTETCATYTPWHRAGKLDLFNC